MPDCDGIKATEQIRTIEAKAAVVGRRQPAVILMITGQDSAEDRQRSKTAGCDAFYVKPVGIKMLDQAIKTYFQDFVPGASKPAVDVGHAMPNGHKTDGITSPPSSESQHLVNGVKDESTTSAGDARGRSLEVDAKSGGGSRDESLKREVRRASQTCHPRSEVVLSSSPVSDVPTEGLQSVMDGWGGE